MNITDKADAEKYKTQYETSNTYFILLNNIEFSSIFKKWLQTDYPCLIDSFFQELGQIISPKTKNSIQKEYYVYEKLKNIAIKIPDSELLDLRIVKKERQLNLRQLVNSCYDKDEQNFIVEELFCKKTQVRKFIKFQEFYTYLEGNLQNSNLTEYDFEQIEMEKFNFDGAYLSNKILIQQGKYDKTFYEKFISAYFDEVSFLPALNEETEAYSINHVEIDSDQLNCKNVKIYYISDIHINHHLFKAFPFAATQDEIRFYIKKIVSKMLLGINKNNTDYLFIAGDISFCFEISRIFYTELSKSWNPSHIIIVLGNHELWDFYRFGVGRHSKQDLQTIIDKYRDLFKSLNLIFLHNELLLMKASYWDSSYEIVSEQDVLKMNSNELQKKSLKYNLLILGGLGFSGYNSKFNASNGIYRRVISTLEEDIYQTKRFEKLHTKLINTYIVDKLIVLTHTPKDDWTTLGYNPNWIYINGHTHKNIYRIDSQCTLYADNQIGYTSMSIGLKFFRMSRNLDIFKYYNDGIYEITKNQYLEFNYGIGIRPTFNRNSGTIIMLKRNGIYCFLFKKLEKNKLYLLNGGQIKKLNNNDTNYYYDNIVRYADIIKLGLKDYNEKLKSISTEIKKLGGNGTVHGCIVDIDFYNHIYLNPYDGTITPYYSPLFGAQKLYQDLPQLLLNHCPVIYQNYKTLVSDTHYLTAKSSSNIQTNESLIFETSQYKISRYIKSLQYITENNVIRNWNDNFISDEQNIENGLLSE